MAKKAKRTWRWVSRDEQSDFVDIWAGAQKPRGIGRLFGDDYTKVCVDEFLALFGFVPKPGECLKVEFSARVVES